MRKKLVLAFVQNTGIRLTGRYRDRLMQYPEIEAVPEAKACVFSDDTPEMRARLEAHVAKEASNYNWMGWFSLENKGDILAIAKQRALEAAA